jgi:1-deoxy-D-xylulose-5-phosphate reductoisomerase
MITLTILGSTGSIGGHTLDVVAEHPERLRVLAIAGRNRERLAAQARRFAVPLVGIAVDADADAAARPVGFPDGTRVLWGPQALEQLATHPEADVVVVATVGRAGLDATLAAVRAGKRVAIANKEVLVMAGAVLTAEAAAHGATIVPIDSEHSALWQCLLGEDRGGVGALLLTASGGALRDRDPATLAGITPEEALRHPTWVMGPKITVDCATLMNKGLEVMEAHWLFDVPMERIRVVMHPSSVVHALVQFRDGTLKAQLGVPDMKAPIQFALSYPERWTAAAPALDLVTASPLVFAEPPPGRYPCLDLALQAGLLGGTYPAVLCGADEVAVELFLQCRIRFTDIPHVIGATLERHVSGNERDIEQIIAADAWAREECRRRAAV